MRYFRMSLIICQCLHDARNAGFVIGAKQCISICHDQGLPLQFLHMREVTDLCCTLFVKNDVTAVIVFNHPRTDTLAGKVRRGIHMCDKTDRFYGSVNI